MWKVTLWTPRLVCFTAPANQLQILSSILPLREDLRASRRVRLKPCRALPPFNHGRPSCRVSLRSASLPLPQLLYLPLLPSQRNSQSSESRASLRPRRQRRSPKTGPCLEAPRLGQRSRLPEPLQKHSWHHNSRGSSRLPHPTTDLCTRPCPSPPHCRPTTRSAPRRRPPARWGLLTHASSSSPQMEEAGLLFFLSSPITTNDNNCDSAVIWNASSYYFDELSSSKRCSAVILKCLLV